jgi:hypothetical protein
MACHHLAQQPLHVGKVAQLLGDHGLVIEQVDIGRVLGRGLRQQLVSGLELLAVPQQLDLRHYLHAGVGRRAFR